MYDNAKLEKAVDRWARERLDIGFGQHYSLELLADFEEWLAKTKVLQASPGRIAFGSQLTRLGLGQRRVNGLVYRIGATLKGPAPEVEPVRRPATVQKDATAPARQAKAALQRRKKAVASKSDREKRKAKVKKAMQQESKERNQAAGEP